MRKALHEIFSDANNRLSSKRIMATATLVFTLGLTIFVIVREHDTNVLIYPYTLVGSLFGFGTLEKKKK